MPAQEHNSNCIAKQALLNSMTINYYTLLKNNKEHFWFQKSCKLGEYGILQVNDCIICQNNRLADVHVFKNSKHTDHQCKNGYDSY